MDEDAYLQMFFEYRRAFFVATRGRKRGPQTGSPRFLANYIGLGASSTEGKDRKLLEAVAFLMYDYVGRVVEAAIRRRRGGRLEAIPQGEQEYPPRARSRLCPGQPHPPGCPGVPRRRRRFRSGR